MASERVIEWTPSDEPLLTSTDAIHDGVVEHLVIHDVTGAYADIKAVCCRRCGYTQEFSTVLGTHRCTTPERQDRLADLGVEAFRRMAGRRAKPTKWYLLSKDDATMIRAALALAERDGNRTCDENGCLCDMGGGPQCGGAPYADAIHTLDSGLHVTDAVPSDFAT